MLHKPPILPEIERVVQLKKSGSNFSGSCPFHMEDTPSFFVFKERFKCFGCGETGDVIDFVQKYYSLDFLEAMKHLEIKTTKAQYSKIKQKQALKNEFKTWESGYFQELCMMIRVCEKLLKEKLSWKSRDVIYKSIPQYKYHADLLQHGDDILKYELFKSVNKYYDFKLTWNMP